MGMEPVEFSILPSAAEHHIPHDAFESKLTIIRVRIAFIFGLIVWMRFDAVDDVQELHALFFRCRAPALEPALVEALDDLLERGYLRFSDAIAPRIGVWRVQFALLGIQYERVLQLRALQSVRREIDGFQQFVERILVRSLDLQLRHEELQDPTQLLPGQ